MYPAFSRSRPRDRKTRTLCWARSCVLRARLPSCVPSCVRACVRLMKLRPGAHLWRRVNAHCSFGRPCNCVRVRRKDGSENSVEWVSQAREKELLCGPSRLRGFPKRRKKGALSLRNEIFSPPRFSSFRIWKRKKKEKKRKCKKTKNDHEYGISLNWEIWIWINR